MKSINEIAKQPRLNNIAIGEDGLSFLWSDGKWNYVVIASNGMGWDHVSVSCRNKRITPSWDVMCRIKDICFEPDEVVVQFHPKKSEYVNITNNCLHLWKPQNIEILTPPIILV